MLAFIRRAALVATFIVAAGAAPAAMAQSTATPTLPGKLVTSGCPRGFTSCYVPYSNTNPLPVSGTFSATLSGFAPNGNYATLTATNASSASTALPAGTDVGFHNTSSVDVSCVLAAGAATATTNKIIVPAGSTVFATVGANDHAACINQTGSASNVVTLMGGAGLGTNFGGGGGSGGNVTVTGPLGVQTIAASVATTNPSIGADGSAVKANSSLIGVSDGTNQQQVVAPIGLGDGVNGNNTVSVGGFVWNGTTWDRMPGSTTGVTVKQATAANLNATAVLAAGSAIIGKTSQVDSGGTDATDTVNHAVRVNVVSGSTGNAAAGNTGSAVPAQGDFIAGGAAGGAGNLTGSTVKAASTAAVATDTSLVIDANPGGALVAAINAAIPAGTNLIGKVGIDQTTPGTTNNVSVTSSASGAQAAEVHCDSHVFKHITSATDTLAVQGVTAKQIKVCGAMAQFSGSAAQAVFLENTASTNANCSSANTQISGAWTGNSASPSTVGFYNARWGGLANTSANGLCINSTGTGGVDVDIWYTQGS